jgi:hypothetical protein
MTDYERLRLIFSNIFHIFPANSGIFISTGKRILPNFPNFPHEPSRLAATLWRFSRRVGLSE